MSFELSEEIINNLRSVLEKFKVVEKAVIFGSRARGDQRYNSDIDIAVYTNGAPIPGLSLEIDDAAGIYKTNVVVIAEITNQNFLKNITSDGVEFYQRNKA